VGIRFANRRFAPSLVGTGLAIVGIAIFLQLGFWQLQRAEQKELLQSSYERGQETTVTLTAANANTLPRYQRVQAQGRYLSERQILLDNMPSTEGRPGYRVLTPFELDAGGLILIDRGWIPMGDRRTDLPQLHVAGNRREISGRLDELPRPGLRMGESIDQSAGWPRVLNFPEHATIERALGMAVAERIVLLDASHPDGFQRVWHAVARVGPERHIGYAVQWFAFALVAIAIYFIVSLRRTDTSDA
jgi:surfeit locus 1 family protein